MMIKLFSSLKEYFIKDRWYLAAGFLSLIIVDSIQLIIPLLIKGAIDSLAGGSASNAPLTYYALRIAAAGLVIAVFRFFWRYCLIGTSRRIEKALRDRLFSHIIALPLKNLLVTKTGDLMARMTNDLDAVRMCTGIGLVALADTFFLGASSVIFMLCISPLLTALALTPLLFIIFITGGMSRLLHQRFSKVQATFSRITEKVQETISGITVIKAFAHENAVSDSFKKLSTDYIAQNLRLVRVWGILFPLIVLFSNVSIGVLIFFGGRLTLSNSITVGDFVAFTSYIWILTWPMMALGWVVNLFQRGSASLIRLNEILGMEPEPAAGDAVISRPLIKGRIDIRSLSFSYRSGVSPVLKNITLSILPGQTVGITGKIGSGKTTLCNLLLRFFDPPPGTIFVDAADICDMALPALRSSIAYVPQDSFLFSDTIRDNILFGNPEAPDDEINKQAENAHILREIMDFSDGFTTMVGEKGITLSGGQKQRLCIARALLVKAPVLILDDALSSLDVSTTQHIVQALKSSPARQTSIIISNRIASIMHADTIYVFGDGEIVERGTHRELVDAQGLYYSLYLRQKLEYDTE